MLDVLAQRNVLLGNLQHLERVLQLGVSIAHGVAAVAVLGHGRHLGQQTVVQQLGGRVDDERLTHLGLRRRGGQRQCVSHQVGFLDLLGHVLRHQHGLGAEFVLYVGQDRDVGVGCQSTATLRR